MESNLNDSLLIDNQTTGLDIDSYSRLLYQQSIDKKTELSQLSNLITNITEEILQLKQQINRVTGLIDIANREKASYLQNKDYIAVVSWFQREMQIDSPNKSILEDRLNLLANSISEVSSNIDDLKILIDSEQLYLGPYSIFDLNSRRLVNEGIKNQSEHVIATYRNLIDNELGLIIDGIDVNSLSEALDKKDQELKTEADRKRELTSDYSKLVEFGKNLVPFLQSEDAKKKVKQAEDDLSFLIERVKPNLELEKRSIKSFLEEKIKQFFYTDLIDQIYNKIDPHPDFKCVEFRADFDSEIPRLDVLVTNNLNQQKLIPNLYFSTAQINILSLSIFLATALNSREYNCIFIDDPIQSMDSINVLSTIDLLRGIIATGEKQIILSTHDINFHNLLMKKIPPTIFKSRFLELETFGKVSG
jgi:DNA repair protein SbcC/Rad50